MGPRSIVFVAALLVFRSNQILYSTDQCPLIHVQFGEKYVRKSSWCCGVSAANLTACDVSGTLFWNESEIPIGDWTPIEATTPVAELTKLPSQQRLERPRAKFEHLYPVSDWKRGWYDDEYDDIVNRYWMEFPPPSHEAHYAFAAVYFILTAVSLCGNSLVFVMIVRFKSLRTPSNVLVANLAVADFFMMSRGPIFIYNSLNFGPITGYIGCQLYGVIGGLTGVAASTSLAFIACDRCSVIIHTFEPEHKLTHKKAAITVAFIWLYAAFFATLPFTGRGFGIKPYVPEGYLTSCSFDYISENTANRLFILVFFVGAWCVPFTIITSSYYKICHHVLGSSLTRIGQERQQRKVELRLAALVVLMIAVWFLSWTPYAAVALTGISGNRHLLTPLLTMLPAVFCKTAATIDPFLYALNHPRFRRELLRLWCPKIYEKRRADTAVSNQAAIWRSDGSTRLSIRRERTQA